MEISRNLRFNFDDNAEFGKLSNESGVEKSMQSIPFCVDPLDTANGGWFPVAGGRKSRAE